MKSRGGWTFTYIGIHPDTQVGVMVFTKGSETATVEMVSWPKSVVQLPPSNMRKENVPPKPDTNATTVTSGAELLALIRQGQRL